MVSPEVARNVVGMIGNFISFGFFLSPAPTFWRIIKRKSVEECNSDAHIIKCLNCMFWILYGLPVVHPDSILVSTINSIGLVIELIYLAIFCIYDHEGTERKNVALGLYCGVASVANIALITFLALHTDTSRSLLVGIICNIFNIIMYASPLAIVKKVIITKSVEYMPFFLSLAGFANGCIWTAYALIKLDYFILISNGLGGVLGFVQLVVYGCYHKSTPKKGEGVVKPTDVQFMVLVLPKTDGLIKPAVLE